MYDSDARVRTDINNQGLTVTQKGNARMNIDAPSSSEMTSAIGTEATLRNNADIALGAKADALEEQVDEIKNDISDLSSLSSALITMHIALASGRVCGAKRPDCGQNGRFNIQN